MAAEEEEKEEEAEAINTDDSHDLETGVTEAKGNDTAGCFDSFICSALKHM